MRTLRGLLMGPSLAGSKPGWLIGEATAGKHDRLSWDEAAQAYRGFVAFERDRAAGPSASSSRGMPQPKGVLLRLRGAGLPRAPSPAPAFDSPSAYTPAHVSGLFRRCGP